MEERGSVTTVTGTVAASELGITHSHEHVLWDYWQLIPSYDCVFTEEAVARTELAAFHDAGGGSLVDCTCTGIGPQPEALQRLSLTTGVKIILGCGWYRERVYTPEVFELTASALAKVLVERLTVGYSGCSVRAGFIGEIGTERGHISAAEERVFRAAAFAQRETGVSIWTHTTRFGELALEQIALLTSCGVPVDRIVISHLGDREDPSLVLEIAQTGVYLSIDNIGYVGDGYPDDAVRANSILALLDSGHGRQIVLGTDIGQKSSLLSYGGRGYSWLIRSFLPRLTALGLGEADIRSLTTENVARALATSEDAPSVVGDRLLEERGAID
jgi:phosphotriesterase-related protein